MFQKFLLGLAFIAPIFFTGCSSNKSIIQVATEKEANELVSLLNVKGITAEKIFITSDQGSSWSINVPSEREYDAISIITRQGYPKPVTPDMVSIFAPSGLVPSSQEEQIRYQAVLESQLSSIIKEFDGVIDAYVNISVFQNLNLNESASIRKGIQAPLKASVYIKHTGVLDDISSQLPSKIKKLVSGRLIGLDPENVYVVGERVNNFGRDSISDEIAIHAKRKEAHLLGIRLNAESVSKFRLMIVVLVISITALVLIISFFVWKTMPLIKSNIKNIFSFKQIGSDGTVDISEEKPKEEAKKEEKPKEEAKKEEKPKEEAKKTDNASEFLDDIDDESLGV